MTTTPRDIYLSARANIQSNPEYDEATKRGAIGWLDKDYADEVSGKPDTKGRTTIDPRIEALRMRGLSLEAAVARAREMDAEEAIAAATAASEADVVAFYEAHPDGIYRPFVDWRARDADTRSYDEILADESKRYEEAAAKPARFDMDKIKSDALAVDAARDLARREGNARQALLDQGYTVEQALKAIPEGSLGATIDANATPEQIERVAKWRTGS